MHKALYRKYRPQVFGEVVGQEHVVRTLTREVSEGRVAHAYLFAGPRGTGKTSTARILAKAINCEDPRSDGEPCDDCATCRAISEGSSMDVQELDAASHNSVDNIRDIRVQATMSAVGLSAHRVFILDEAHMLSAAAGNALLKTLEEPPPKVHFILATTEPYRLLDTIRSRSQRFDFHPVGDETLVRHLRGIAEKESYQVGEGGLEAIAHQSGGSIRDSLSLLEQVAALGDGRVEVDGIGRALGVAGRETMMTLARAVADRDAPAVLYLTAGLDKQGVNLRSFVADGIAFFRGAYLSHHLSDLTGASNESPGAIEDWRSAAKMLPVADINRAMDQLGDALVKIREGREERLMLEMALIRIVRPETTVESATLLSRIDALEARFAGQSPAERRVDPAPSPAEAKPDAPSKPSPAPKEREQERMAEPQTPRGPSNGRQSTPPGIQRLSAAWAKVTGSFSGMEGALLRPTKPTDFSEGRLMVDCADTFRLDRLKERGMDKRASEILGKVLGEQASVVFIIEGGKTEKVPPIRPADSAPEQRHLAPVPEERVVGSENGNQADSPASDDEVDPKKFLESAGMTVTKVAHPPRSDPLFK